MITLTESQARLLYLCSKEEGPSIKEMYWFRPSYGISSDTLRTDYILLLQELFVSPIGFIDPENYLPTNCLITEKGKEYLERISEEQPDLITGVNIVSSMFLEKEPEWEEVTKDWPVLEESTHDEVAALAESYLYWAQNPPDRIRIPSEDLYYTAAKGFAKVKDTRRFSRAIRGCLFGLEEKGEHLTIAVLATRTAENYPDYEDIIVSTAGAVLEGPYRDLTGSSLPKITNKEDLENLLKQITSVAVQTGKHYRFKLPDQNSFIGIGNRIEDILGEAFRTANRDLFYQVVQLEYIFIGHAKSMVKSMEEASSFESRAGYKRLVNLAEQGGVILEGYANVVNLEEPLRKIAYKKALEVIRAINRGVILPVRRMCDIEGSDDDHACDWTFHLLGYNEKKMRKSLIRLFTQLHELYIKGNIENGEKEPPVKSLLDPLTIATDLSDIKKRLDKLDEVAVDTKVMRYVQIPIVEDALADLIDFSQTGQTHLEELCRIVLHSNWILQDIDSGLNEMLEDIRKDVNNWISAVEKSTKISDKERERFLKELGEIVKISSAGKLLASIPLIPGFLQYQYELAINIDWNKWLGKLRSLLKRE